MLLEVLKFPDPRLREKSLLEVDFGPKLKKLSEDMLETMYHERGIGLAAAQVGELVQMLVIDCRPKEQDEKKRYEIEDLTELEQKITQPLIVVNPVITVKKGKTTFDEGCLSVPTFFETVERAETITLQYQDIRGKKCELQTDGLLAIVIQHEMDHLDGTLFIDRISFLKSNKIKSQIKKFGYPSRQLDKSSNTDDSEQTEET
jgi:peptide deformylase